MDNKVNKEAVKVEKLNLWYGSFHALKDIDMSIKEKCITAIIGPSGCGKSTLLRTFNRMDLINEDISVSGKIYIDGENILNRKTRLAKLRKKVGMVFQTPNPFPLSIYENVAFGLKIHHMAHGSELDDIVEESLRAVLLWNKLKDKMKMNALKLSLEQKQRLCIARLLAVKPEVLLMDEPCSALDPIATAKIEELMFQLKEHYTIIIVTHNMQQAGRVSKETGFMLLGEMVEFDKTDKIFTRPQHKLTEEYITGRYG
ncbi:MAG: phosphate ABC transporter ATP-binding protein PstB [bacterium]